MSRTVRARLWWLKFSPAEGDSAVAELWVDEQLWADLHLEGIQLDQVGDERVRNARAVMTLFAPVDRPDLTVATPRLSFDLEQMLSQIEAARTWLFENERLRMPE